MTPRKLWTITIFLFIAHLFIQYIFFIKIDITKTSGLLTLSIDLFSNFIIVVGLGAGLGALIAFIPFRQRTFRDKFKRTFPILTSVVLLILITNFAYLAYLSSVNGIEFRPKQKYENIHIPLSLDCSSIRNGKFETLNLWIERNGNKQTQTDKKTGNKQEFVVEWLNNCEYILTPVINGSERLRIKIISITPEKYDCYIISDKYPDGYANFATIKRIR